MLYKIFIFTIVYSNRIIIYILNTEKWNILRTKKIQFYFIVKRNKYL